MSTERRTGVLFVVTVAVVLALILIVFASTHSKGFQYTVVFDKGKNIRVGDIVQMNGVDIGEVDAVEFPTPDKVHVRLKIDNAHKDKVYLESTAYIRDANFPNISGQMIVEVINAPGASTAPMPAGSVIEGKDSRIELWTWQGKEKIQEWAGDLESVAKDLSEGAKSALQGTRELQETEQAQTLLQKLSEFLLSMGAKGVGAVAAMLEKWNTLKAEIGPFLEKMKEAGKDALVENFKKIMEGIETFLNELREAQEGSEGEAGPLPIEV